MRLVGERRHDRQLIEARTAYVAAYRRLCAAIGAYNDRFAQLPLEPPPGVQPQLWAREDVDVVMANAAAWRDVAETRRRWEGLAREWGGR